MPIAFKNGYLKKKNMNGQQHLFKKSLTLIDSTAIVMGSMIGSGIFIVSADMSRNLGSPGWLLLAWIITGLLTIAAALSYGELASMMPKAGGQYVYLCEAYNPLCGFLYGWTLFLVIQTGTIAAVGMAFAKFMGVLYPWFSEQHILLNLGYFRFNTVQLLAIASIAVLTWNNMRGISAGKWVQNIFTFLKVFVLIGFVVLGLMLARNTSAIAVNQNNFWDPVSSTGSALAGWALIVAMGTAMVGSLFSADAWNNITFTAGEVINPRKNIPLSLFLGTGTVIVLYILANIVYLQTLPLRGIPDASSVFERGIQYATNDRLGTATMSGLFGESAAMLMAIFIVISTFGCNNGLILSGARVYYAMAKDGLFFRKVGMLNNKDVPANGLLIQGLWASLLCLTGKYGELLNYVIFAVLIFYALTIAGVFILRYKRPSAERPYKAFGYPIVPAVYIIAALLIVFILLIYKTDNTWPGLIIVVLGIPVFYIWRNYQKK
jgi:basic amino acid/polyamine antiporter, APA family